jgi:hypothetical protein
MSRLLKKNEWLHSTLITINVRPVWILEISREIVYFIKYILIPRNEGSKREFLLLFRQPDLTLFTHVEKISKLLSFHTHRHRNSREIRKTYY